MVGISKSSWSHGLANWVNQGNAPICIDASPYPVWNDWEASQRDLFITDLNDSSNPHPQYYSSEARITFDDINDRVQINQSNTSILSKTPFNNSSDDGVNDWYHSQGIFSGKNPNLLELSNQNGFQFGKADKNSSPTSSTSTASTDGSGNTVKTASPRRKNNRKRKNIF